MAVLLHSARPYAPSHRCQLNPPCRTAGSSFNILLASIGKVRVELTSCDRDEFVTVFANKDFVGPNHAACVIGACHIRSGLICDFE
jgi:hypothetical protein